MQIFRNKTLLFLTYHVVEQGIRSYFHWRSAASMGRELQKHEMRKDGISLAKNMAKAVVQAVIYDLDSL